MKNKKHWLIITLVLTMIFSSTLAVNAATEASDYDSGSYAGKAYEASLYVIPTKVSAYFTYETETANNVIDVSLYGQYWVNGGTFTEFYGSGSYGSCSSITNRSAGDIISGHCNYYIQGTWICDLAAAT